MSALEALLESQENTQNSERENDRNDLNEAFITHEEADDGLDGGSGEGDPGGGGSGEGGPGGGGPGEGGSDDGGFGDGDGPAQIEFIQVLTVQVECYSIT